MAKERQWPRKGSVARARAVSLGVVCAFDASVKRSQRQNALRPCMADSFSDKSTLRPWQSLCDTRCTQSAVRNCKPSEKEQEGVEE